jgi:hypothetical protein
MLFLSLRPSGLCQQINARGSGNVVVFMDDDSSADLPAWAEPFSEVEDEGLVTAEDKNEKPHTPKIGSLERKAILDVLRAEVAAEQKRENPEEKYEPVVFTPQHFRVLGQWAFVDATMKPAYGEQGGLIAVLQRVGEQWQVKFTSYADDVTMYDQLAKKLGAPRSVFPAQGKVEE